MPNRDRGFCIIFPLDRYLLGAYIVNHHLCDYQKSET